MALSVPNLRRPDQMIAIIGGGPAGAMAALTLAKAGRAAVVFEREAAPTHRICGEFLSVEAHAALRGAGVDPAALGAVTIDRLRLVHDTQVAELALPFVALGLSRKAMDAALLGAAEAAGTDVRRGVAVRHIEDVDARTIILASGKHDLRGAARDRAETMDDLVGFKVHFAIDAAQAAVLAGHIEIVLFDGGYAGLQMIEGGAANLCLLVSRARLARSGKRWDALLEEPHLATRLTGATPLFERPLTIANVPYGFRYRPAPGDPPNLYRVGDQLAVIPSFAGDGMAIALHSGRGAARAILHGVPAPQWHNEQRVRLAAQMRLARLMHAMGRPTAMQPLIVAAARLFPPLARAIALGTRLPSSVQ